MPVSIFFSIDKKAYHSYFNSCLILIIDHSYQGHRFGPESKERYLPTADHWQLLALKFGFVIIFQNVIASMVIVIRWIIPDVPRALRQQIRQHEYLTNELIIQQELKRAKEAQ